MTDDISKEQKQELYDIFKQKILEKKYTLNKTRFKDDEIIQFLLDTILQHERQRKVGLLKYLDLKNIDFKDQNIIQIDFKDTNAIIDPQTVLDKDLQQSTLYGDFKGKSFDNTNICGTNFENTQNVKINPQKLKGKKIINANVTNVDFDNQSFEGVKTDGTDFTYAKNCEINKSLFYKYKKKILEIK